MKILWIALLKARDTGSGIAADLEGGLKTAFALASMNPAYHGRVIH